MYPKKMSKRDIISVILALRKNLWLYIIERNSHKVLQIFPYRHTKLCFCRRKSLVKHTLVIYVLVNRKLLMRLLVLLLRKRTQWTNSGIVSHLVLGIFKNKIYKI